MGQVVPFNFEGAEVRVIDQSGEPWFVAADVCKALSLTNPSVAIKALDEDEKAKFNLGRQGDATIISVCRRFWPLEATDNDADLEPSPGSFSALW